MNKHVAVLHTTVLHSVVVLHINNVLLQYTYLREHSTGDGARKARIICSVLCKDNNNCFCYSQTYVRVTGILHLGLGTYVMER